MSSSSPSSEKQQQQQQQQQQKPTFQLSEGEKDEEGLIADATALLKKKENNEVATGGEGDPSNDGGDGDYGSGKWNLVDEGRGLERTFKFKTFKVTWAFMSQIATECNKPGLHHHPEWSNVYNTTTIKWTTHRPKGLSRKDVVMARFCDKVAEESGEIV